VASARAIRDDVEPSRIPPGQYYERGFPVRSAGPTRARRWRSARSQSRAPSTRRARGRGTRARAEPERPRCAHRVCRCAVSTWLRRVSTRLLLRGRSTGEAAARRGARVGRAARATGESAAFRRKRVCATRRHMTGRGERPAPGRRNGREKLEGSTDAGGAASGGKRPSTMKERSAASGPGPLARQKGAGKPTPVVEAPILVTSPEPGGYGLLGRSVLVLAEGRLARSLTGRAGEGACCVAVVRGDVPGVQLGADPADRCMSERGKRPGGARRTLGFGAGAPSAVAAGAWRRTRSSRGSHDPPGRAGEPSAGRRGPVSTRHDRMGGGRR
jgi:hypothetical protein